MNVLITGTSSGIGSGIAKEFLKQGNSVWGISRRVDLELIKNSNYKHLQLDLTDYHKLEEEIPFFIEKIQNLDLLVLNSGILGEIKWASEQSVDEMKRVMEVNVWGNKVLLDILFKQDFKITQVVGISSGASLRSTPGWAAYALSKSALNLLMQAYSVEFTKTHFSALAPGLVDTEIQEYIYNVADKEHYPAVKRLSEARYTEVMPTPETAAPKLIESFKKAMDYPSGSYLDIREM